MSSNFFGVVVSLTYHQAKEYFTNMAKEAAPQANDKEHPGRVIWRGRLEACQDILYAMGLNEQWRWGKDERAWLEWLRETAEVKATYWCQYYVQPCEDTARWIGGYYEEIKKLGIEMSEKVEQIVRDAAGRGKYIRCN